MNSLTDNRELSLLYKSALLPSESADEYNALRDGLLMHLKPRDMIEHIYTASIVHIDWEVVRTRRHKAMIVSIARREALVGLLDQHLDLFNYDSSHDLARRFFTNKAVKKQVLKSFRPYGLDEAAIEAEAGRISMDHTERLDRRLAELESRRDRLLRQIDNHRAGLAIDISARSDECLIGEVVLTVPARAG